MHSNISFILSPDILKEIPFDRYEQNFTFIVNGKEFRTSRFLADLISPTIRQYHLIDETLDEFTLDLKGNKSSLAFSDFLKITSFEKIELTEEELQYYMKILFLLGNRENIDKSLPFMKEDITLNNVFERISYKEKYFEELIMAKKQENSSNNDDIIFDHPDEPFQKEIDFLSTHFSEIDQEKLKSLRVSVIESIISNPQLLLENEDSLFQFIISLYLENSSFSYLFEHVDFLNISQDCITEFYEKFDLNDINHSIWLSLSKRSKTTEKVSNKHKCKEEKKRKEEKEEERQLQPDESIVLNLVLASGRPLRVVCSKNDPMKTIYDIASNESFLEEEWIVLVHEGRVLDRENLIGSFNLPRDAKICVFYTGSDGA